MRTDNMHWQFRPCLTCSNVSSPFKARSFLSFMPRLHLSMHACRQQLMTSGRQLPFVLPVQMPWTQRSGTWTKHWTPRAQRKTGVMSWQDLLHTCRLPECWLCGIHSPRHQAELCQWKQSRHVAIAALWLHANMPCFVICAAAQHANMMAATG